MWKPGLFVLALTAATPAVAQEKGAVYGGLQLGQLSTDTSGAASIDGDDLIYGLHVGYDLDLGLAVVGGELDVDFGDIELGGGAETIDSVTRFKLRAGRNVGDALIYGTAGLARADASLGTDNGTFLGAGVGFDTGTGWVLGGELLIHDFDDFENTGIDIEATTFTARASFRF
ncbi:MAG: outer membrane beta-barrel protein [Pseudomonadota bacterium]